MGAVGCPCTAASVAWVGLLRDGAVCSLLAVAVGYGTGRSTRARSVQSALDWPPLNCAAWPSVLSLLWFFVLSSLGWVCVETARSVRWSQWRFLGNSQAARLVPAQTDAPNGRGTSTQTHHVRRMPGRGPASSLDASKCNRRSCSASPVRCRGVVVAVNQPLRSGAPLTADSLKAPHLVAQSNQREVCQFYAQKHAPHWRKGRCGFGFRTSPGRGSHMRTCCMWV